MISLPILLFKMLPLRKKSLELQYNLVFRIKIFRTNKAILYMNEKTVIKNLRQKKFRTTHNKIFCCMYSGNSLVYHIKGAHKNNN